MFNFVSQQLMKIRENRAPEAASKSQKGKKDKLKKGDR